MRGVASGSESNGRGVCDQAPPQWIFTSNVRCGVFFVKHKSNAFGLGASKPQTPCPLVAAGPSGPLAVEGALGGDVPEVVVPLRLNVKPAISDFLQKLSARDHIFRHVGPTGGDGLLTGQEEG